MSEKPYPERYYMLDAVRGIAAIAVMQFHLGFVWFTARSGYVAVDLFYMLSGFVLATTYIERFRNKLSFWSFFKIRLIRLYPLYILGILLGTAFALAGVPTLKVVTHVWQNLPFALVMLPAPVSEGNFFPLNSPSWSLFFEMALNIAFALTYTWLRPKWVIMVVALSGVCLLGLCLYQGVFEGWNWQTFPMGVARAVFSFSVGCLIYCFNTGKPRVSRFVWLIVVGLLCLVFYLPHTPKQMVLFALLTVFLANPLIVWLGTRYEVPAEAIPLAKFLGDISFPLYVIHWPFCYVSIVWLVNHGVSSVMALLLYCAAMIALAYALSRVDAAVRKQLMARFVRPVVVSAS